MWRAAFKEIYATANRDFLVFGYYGPNGDGSNAYYFEDPANCANVAGLAAGSIRKYNRVDRGDYYGTMNVGTYTIGNEEESTQGYIRWSAIRTAIS
jgi:hypothetical protein